MTFVIRGGDGAYWTESRDWGSAEEAMIYDDKSGALKAATRLAGNSKYKAHFPLDVKESVRMAKKVAKVAKKRGRPVGSKNKITKKRGRPVGSKNKKKIGRPKKKDLKQPDMILEEIREREAEIEDLTSELANLKFAYHDACLDALEAEYPDL